LEFTYVEDVDERGIASVAATHLLSLRDPG
jgi:hypothetical protein